MFSQVCSKRIADWLVQGGAIAAEEREVYEFGLDKLFSSLVNFFFVVALGLLFGVLLQAMVFYVAYIMLRVYAGGYHAEKPLTCFFASIIVLIPCLVAIRFYQIWNVPVVFWSLLVGSAAVLVLLGPVEHRNKPLDALEKIVYRCRMLRNLVILATGTIILLRVSFLDYAASMLCGIVLSASTVGAGKIKSIV